MPKLVINRGRNPGETKLISERTEQIKTALRDQTGGDFIRLPDIAQYLKCCYKTAYKLMHAYPQHNLPSVRHACGTKSYHTIDVARRLAELEALHA